MKQFKCVVVGNSGVGKTSLLVTYQSGQFPDEYIPAIADDDITFQSDDAQMSLLDTVGTVEFPFRPLVYPETDVFLLCFSLVDIDSFKDLFTIWYPELNHWNPNTPLILVGTKLDLRENVSENISPVITIREGQQMAEDIGAVEYVECSALLKKGVQGILDAAVLICMRNESFKVLERDKLS